MAKEVQANIGSSYNSLTYGSKIEGDIVADSDFRIDGEVLGNIICKGKVVIGPHGLIKGNISCDNAEIIGTVIGNFKISETLTLRATSNITGEVSTNSLVVEPNAVFNGSCTMKKSNP